MKRIAILHFAGPPTVGGVESTIFQHARLMAAAGDTWTRIFRERIIPLLEAP